MVPATNRTLAWHDHDMATALGDAAFLCVDQSFVKTYNDTLISTVRMRWNNSYHNYAECDDRQVGIQPMNPIVTFENSY